MSNDSRAFGERRKGPDFWTKFINWIGYLAWFIEIAIIMLADRAKPPVETFFDRYFSIKLRSGWDTDVMTSAFYLMIVLFIICIITLYINSKRHRRKTDRYNHSVIILSILSFAGIIVCLFAFIL